jgi:DNA-directed RNA polymerase specialized sigma24 family protein
MSVDLDRPPSGPATCPCRHGDVGAEVARQRPLLERAGRGDLAAFAQLFDDQVEGVYRYLLAWAGDRAAAEELTALVFHTALTWAPVIAGEVEAPTVEAGAPYPEAGDVGVWLIAMARDAVTQWRGTGWMAGPAEREVMPADALGAVALLGDPEREVVVLRLLLGHSLAHTAHLSGYSRRTVLQLQLAACLAVRSLTAGPAIDPADPAGGPPAPGPEGSDAATAERALELERLLERWDVDVAGDDVELADALAVASSLRLAAPSRVVAPAYAFVERLRAELLAARPAGDGHDPAAPPPAGGGGRRAAARDGAGGGPGPEAPKAAAGGLRERARRAVAAARLEVSLRPRPWAATMVAVTLTVVILAVQAFGSPPPRPRCRGTSCPPASIVAAPASATAAPLTSIRRRETTTTVPPTLPAPTTLAAAVVPTAPPTTAPPATAPRTTRPPRTTTTRQPATTAATTTSSTTTSTTAPPPPP